MFSTPTVTVYVALLTRFIVTIFTKIFRAEFGLKIIAKHCYILAIEIKLQVLSYKKHKNLSSQSENYIFGVQTIKNNYAAETCFSGKLFSENEKWTFINVQKRLSQNTFQRKNMTF
jgi:hypothetical protein